MKKTFKDYRLEAIGTQAQAAKKFKVDVTTISFWENGKTMPKTKDLPRIAKALGITTDELIASLLRCKQ